MWRSAAKTALSKAFAAAAAGLALPPQWLGFPEVTFLPGKFTQLAQPYLPLSQPVRNLTRSVTDQPRSTYPVETSRRARSIQSC